MITKTWGEVRVGDQVATASGDVWHVELASLPAEVEIRRDGVCRSIARKLRPATPARVLERTDPGYVAKPPAVCWDIETGSAGELFRYGRGLYRLGQADALVTTDGDALAAHLARRAAAGDLLVGHNICAFDLLVLARYHGLDLASLRGRIVDTDLLARVLDPPPSGRDGISAYPKGHYGLDATAKRFGAAGKTDDLKGLAERHGGYDKISSDDAEYRAYLQGDIDATRGLWDAVPPLSPYARREMDVGLLTSQMTLNGFRVDVPELHRALDQQAQDKAAALGQLHTIAGVPLNGKSPLASDAGKAALETYLTGLGLRRDKLPRTPKTGKLQTGREALEPVLAAVRSRGGLPELEHVLSLVMEVVGQRTVYRTADTCRVGDRVHPGIRPTQASGRWSVTNPGLTVYGKRGGRHVERRIFLPEEGHALISIDLDQVDARAVAAHSQDPAYMRIFQQGLDVHGEVAEEVFGDRGKRELVKAIVHGWNYGRGAKAISEATGLALEVTEHFDSEMRRKYPALVAWQRQVREIAESGRLLDNGFGRRLRADPRYAYTQAPALVGQGATRDILAEGMLRLPVEYWPFLRTVVHDELVASVPVADAVEIGREIVKAMSFDFRGVPITSGCSRPGINWADVYGK